MSTIVNKGANLQHLLNVLKKWKPFKMNDLFAFFSYICFIMVDTRYRVNEFINS